VENDSRCGSPFSGGSTQLSRRPRRESSHARFFKMMSPETVATVATVAKALYLEW